MTSKSVPLKSDYGLFLVRQGYKKDVSHFFYSVPLYDLAFIDRTLFSTMLVLPVDGQDYVVSFDFPGTLLSAVIALAPETTQRFIRDTLASVPLYPYKIQMYQPFFIGIEAKLGELVTVEREQFVPMIVQKVFAAE